MSTRSRGALVLVGLLMVGCGAMGPSSAAATPTGGISQSSSASPSTSSEPMPGRPYDEAAVLQAMQDSRRPGGVPAQLQTEGVAAAVAAELWTWDGSPWPVLVIGGACGPSTCSLEVSGAPVDAAGGDLYLLRVDASTASVSVESTDLHGYPTTLDAQLQSAAQAADPDAVEGLAYLSAQWLPPPDAGKYWVAYRSGGEEGSRGVDLLIELASGEVIHRRTV